MEYGVESGELVVVILLRNLVSSLKSIVFSLDSQRIKFPG